MTPCSSTRHRWRCLVFIFLGLALLVASCDRPTAMSQVDDRAALLDTDRVARLEAFQEHLRQDIDIHFQLTLLAKSPTNLDAEALRLFEAHRLGSTTRGARGVLLLVDPVGEQVRLEIGYDLEGIFPDGFVGYVEREQMAPFFAAGRIADGVEATVELLVGRALEEVPADYGGTTSLAHLSGGAGARLATPIGGGARPKEAVADHAPFTAQPSPRQTLERYLEALQGHIKDPELGIYTPATREFFRQWLVTNAQQDNEHKGLEKNLPLAEEHISGSLAVLRFPVENRQAAPYFFRRGDEGWQLDMVSMSRLLDFNHKNQWFFRHREHEFAFAFDDLHFDANGFPHRR
ncbi:MAG: YgcG family protein [Desulfuromonadales bacterium]